MDSNGPWEDCYHLGSKKGVSEHSFSFSKKRFYGLDSVKNGSGTRRYGLRFASIHADRDR